MTPTKLALLLLFALALAAGQVLFKAAAQSLKGHAGFDLQTLAQLLLNPYFLLSVAIYAANAVLWVWLLRDTELNKAYLVVALALILVPLAGTFFFQEPFSIRLLFALVIILLGLAVAFW